MIGSAPGFWWIEGDWRAMALAPLAAVYGAVARRRLINAPREKIELPVLCVGNFTVGGSGKTPVAIALAGAAGSMGLRPGFLSRGHGSQGGEPRLVDPRVDEVVQVGDEPLMLAAHAPVAVTPDRAAGARLLASQGCDFLIMDDGFQSARIHIDCALIVVDGRYGLGNGQVIPAGPLRAPLEDQLRFADALLDMGEGTAADPIIDRAAAEGKAIFKASAQPRNPERFAGRRFLAFAGIGHPQKFFDTLRSVGGIVAIERPFPDHHVYSERDIRDMVLAADAEKLAIVTTSKDFVRLKGLDGVRDRIETLEIDVAFDPATAAERIIDATRQAWRDRCAVVTAS